MLAAFRQVLMSPATGIVATGIAVALAATIGILVSGWESQRVEYEARIVDLNLTAVRAQSDLRRELTACHTVHAARAVDDATYTPKPAVSAEARRLLERGPEGIDACARMESADRAVLSNLKK